MINHTGWTVPNVKLVVETIERHIARFVLQQSLNIIEVYFWIGEIGENHFQVLVKWSALPRVKVKYHCLVCLSCLICVKIHSIFWNGEFARFCDLDQIEYITSDNIGSNKKRIVEGLYRDVQIMDECWRNSIVCEKFFCVDRGIHAKHVF